MAEKIVPTAIALSRDLFQGVTDQEEQSVEDNLNCIKNDLREIMKTEVGQRLIKNVGKLAKNVGTLEGFQGIVKELFQLAKEVTGKVMNGLSSHPLLATLAIFLLLLAALVVYIYLVPESTVAVWVNSLIHDLGVVLANIFHRLKDFTMAVAEFLKSSGLELSVQLLPTFNLALRVPLAN